MFDFDLHGFFVAFFSDWVGWMSGLVSIILTIVGFRIKAETAQRWFWTAAIVCFFIAAVHIWTIEHRKYQETVTQLNDSYPKLVGHIDSVITFDLNGEINTGVAYLIVAIRNTGGGDSIASKFKLYATFDGKTFKGEPVILNQSMMGNKLDVDRHAMLAEKVAENPIPKGGLRRGWMTYFFRDLRSKDLEKAEMKFVFADVRDIEYSVGRDWADTVRGKTMYYPGAGSIPNMDDDKK